MSSASDAVGLRRARFARRLPATLAALAGPHHGAVSLPLHLAWSGLREFDLDHPRLRMSCYRIALAEGSHDDLVEYLNRDLILAMWPILRTLISRDIRDVWENAFGELKELDD
ncbi:transcriptional regulator [Streptomyces arboris]|uniref:transcriptional regulator n=1 Tax=Streptomyces arboris TaxID=2600619 RepID=UPI003BF51023